MGQCGMVTNYANLTASCDASNATVVNQAISISTQVGDQCMDKNYCFDHGTCDYCFNECKCFDGFGGPNDVFEPGSLSIDCSQRVCPAGRAWSSVPSLEGLAHTVQECSNARLCDRSQGSCVCFPGFTGDACERNMCPNDCSGHGQCKNMAEMA